MKVKKYIVILFIILVLPLFTLPAHAIEEPFKPRVAFIPLVCEESDPQVVLISQRVSDEIRVKLKLITAFNVSTVETLDPYGDPAVLGEFAKENKLDNILFGRLGRDRRENIVVRMSVYDRNQGRIVKSLEKTSPSIFEVFSVADRLLNFLVQEFSGMHVGFGSLELNNSGEEGEYAVFIDEVLLGRNLQRVSKVFNGLRAVEIIQERMFGRKRVFSGEVIVYEDQATGVDFQIPYLLEKEKRALEKYERSIKKFKGVKEETNRVLDNYSKLILLLEDVSYSTRLEELRERYRQEEVEYRLHVNRWEIEDNFYRPKKRVIDDLEKISGKVETYRDPMRVRDMLMDNASFLFTIFRLNAAYAFSEGLWGEGAGYYEQMERIVRTVPLEDKEWFVDEKRYIDKRWQRYQKKAARNVVMADIGIGISIAAHFRRLIATAEKLFKRYGDITEKELIILTDPPGMQLFIDDNIIGTSPVRIKRLRGERIKVDMDDPWHERREFMIDLTEKRNFAFFYSPSRAIMRTRPVEVLGKNRYRLAWDGLAEAVSYTVQINELDGSFVDPIFIEQGIRENEYLCTTKLESGKSYRFRVQGISKNGIASGWVYSEAFRVD